jgi:hypothetical protein
VLATEPSATLREQLVAEIHNLKVSDELALWSHRRPPAENTLTADDAIVVEAAHQSPILPPKPGDRRPKLNAD